MQHPPLSVLLSEDATTLERARAFRSLGLVPLPIRSPEEVEREWPRRLELWLSEHPTADEDELEREKARIIARLGKQPLVPWRGGMWVQAPPTDEQMALWWGGEEGERRPIFLLTGPGAGLCVIDIDTYKGGEPEPWVGLASVVTRNARSGGQQAWYAEADVKTDNDQLGPGLDRRGRGGGVVAPSGRATPGRTFERLAWPLTAFPAEAMPRPKAAPTSATAGGVPRFSPALLSPASSMSRAIVGPVGDGHRTAAAKEIVGMLCRPAPLPDDAIAAVLGLLEDWLGATQPDVLTHLRPLYDTALRAPVCRPVEMAETIVAVWAELRCSPPWRPSAGEPRQVARSLWQTSATGEAMWVEAHVPSPEAPPETPPAVVPEGAPPAEDNPVLRQFMPREIDIYDRTKFRARLTMPRVSIATLPAWARRGDPRHADNPYGHGLGRVLDRAIGGLRRGRLLGIVAPTAKGGKTALLQQLVDGLTMLSVERLDDPAGGPLFLAVYVSEMDADTLAERSLARYLGVTQGLFQGDDEAVILADIVEQHFAEPDNIFEQSKRFRRFVDLGKMRRAGIAEGPALVDEIAKLTESARAWLAWETGREVDVVMVFDPYQRRVDETIDTTAAETAIVKHIRETTDAFGWITLLTSDTTKAAATGEVDPKLSPGAINTMLARGSYALIHNVDGMLGLVVEGSELDEAVARVYVSHTRHGRGSTRPLEFRYWRSLGRFVPDDPTTRPPVPAPAPTITPADGGGGETEGGEHATADLRFVPSPPKRGDYLKKKRAQQRVGKGD